MAYISAKRSDDVEFETIELRGRSACTACVGKLGGVRLELRVQHYRSLGDVVSLSLSESAQSAIHILQRDIDSISTDTASVSESFRIVLNRPVLWFDNSKVDEFVLKPLEGELGSLQQILRASNLTLEEAPSSLKALPAVTNPAFKDHAAADLRAQISAAPDFGAVVDSLTNAVMGMGASKEQRGGKSRAEFRRAFMADVLSYIESMHPSETSTGAQRPESEAALSVLPGACTAGPVGVARPALDVVHIMNSGAAEGLAQGGQSCADSSPVSALSPVSQRSLASPSAQSSKKDKGKRVNGKGQSYEHSRSVEQVQGMGHTPTGAGNKAGRSNWHGSVFKPQAESVAGPRREKASGAAVGTAEYWQVQAWDMRQQQEHGMRRLAAAGYDHNVGMAMAMGLPMGMPMQWMHHGAGQGMGMELGSFGVHPVQAPLPYGMNTRRGDVYVQQPMQGPPMGMHMPQLQDMVHAQGHEQGQAHLMQHMYVPVPMELMRPMVSMPAKMGPR